MTQTWLGTYALGGEDHDQFAAIADPVAIAAMREPTIERGYCDADGASRAAFMRRMREDSDRAKARALMAEAQQANKRAHRLNILIARLQPLVDRLEHGLRKEHHDAQVCGDNNRRLLAEREIDALHREFNEMARNLAKELAR